MPPVPPGYFFDPKVGMYIDRKTGYAVSRMVIARVLNQSVAAHEATLAALLGRVNDGVSTPVVALRQAQRTLKALYCEYAALGAGGWDRLGKSDFGRLGGKLRWQYHYMENFMDQVTKGELSEAEIANRARMYLGNARKEMFLQERARAHPRDEENVLIEKRDLGAAEHCNDCVRLHGLGWQELGVLPVPGEGTACDGNCRCSLDRREVARERLPDYIGTRKS